MVKLYTLDSGKDLVPTLDSIFQTFQYVFRKTTKVTSRIYQFSPPIFSFIGSQEQSEGSEKFIDIQNAFRKSESEVCNFLNSKFTFSQQIVSLLSATYPGLELLQEFEDTIISFDNINGKIFCKVTIKQAIIKYAGINSDPFKLTLNIQLLGCGFILEKTPTTNLDAKKEKIFLSEKDKKEEIEQALLQNRLSDDRKLSIHILLLNKFFEIKKFILTSSAFEKEILFWMEDLENKETKKILALTFDSLQINYDIADLLCKFLNNKKNMQREENPIACILLMLVNEESYFEKHPLFGLLKSEMTRNRKDKLNTFIQGLKKYIESNYSCKALFLLFKLYSELPKTIFLPQVAETMRKSVAELFYSQSRKDIYIELIELILIQSENDPEKKHLRDFFDKSKYTSFSDEKLFDILLTIYLDEIALSSVKNIVFFKTAYLNALGLNIDEEKQLQEISIDPVYSDLLFNSPEHKEKKNKKIKSGILEEKRELYVHYKKIINADEAINTDKKIKILSLFRKLILNRNIVFSVTSNAGRPGACADNSKASLNDAIFNSTSAPGLPDSSQPSEVVSESVGSKDSSNLNFNDNQEGISTVASTPGLKYGDLVSSGYQSGDSSELGLKIENLGSEECREANFVYKQAVGSNETSIQNSGGSLKSGNSIYPARIARSTFLVDEKTLKEEVVLKREQHSIESFIHSIVAEQGAIAIPLPDTAFYYREKYSVKAKYILDRSLNITVSSGISPDYNYSPKKFFDYFEATVLNASANDKVKELLQLFFVNFQRINEKFIKLLDCCMTQRHCLIEAIDYYNKFYYFERSRAGTSKAFPSEKKLKELGINKIVENIFFLEFELFYCVSAQTQVELLQTSLNNSLNYLSVESPVIQPTANDIKRKKTDALCASFIDLDFQYFLMTNFLKIRKEIYFLESHVNTSICQPSDFFSLLKIGIFFGENLLTKLKKNIYRSQTEGSYEQRTTELIVKLKKLSWLRLFFIGIFFWSTQSKARIFERLERRLIAIIYREKLNQIKALEMSLEQSINSFNAGLHDLNENQTIASNFVKFVSIVDSLLAYPIPQHLDMPAFVEMEVLTNAERAHLLETVKLFTRRMSFYWEKCLLPGQEEKINKSISDSERQQNIILEKVEKIGQDFQNAIKLRTKNTNFFSLDSKSNRVTYQETSKLVNIQKNLSGKCHP